jgi:sugar phosphate isomerase/epimerase
MNPINRREFMRKGAAGLASLPALAGISCTTTPEPAPPKPAAPAGPPLGLPIGVQLYTVRDQCVKDFEGTIKQIAAIGYKNLEIYDFYGKTAVEAKKLFDAHGLRAVSGHWMLPVLQKKLPKAIEDAKTVGCEYMVMPILENPADRKTLDQYRKLVASFNKIGEQVKKAGLQFAYHNHNFEFQTLDGKLVYEYLLAELDPELVKMEMDCFWVTHAGHDPVALMEKYPGRFALLHIKDLKAGNEPATELDADKGTSLFAEVGSGTIDWKRIFAAAPKGGLKHYFVEQDFCERDPLESIKMSFDYLSKLSV